MAAGTAPGRPRDPEALAKHPECVCDPQGSSTMASTAQRHVLKNYSWNVWPSVIAYSRSVA